jgi:hypothetical protein
MRVQNRILCMTPADSMDNTSIRLAIGSSHDGKHACTLAWGSGCLIRHAPHAVASASAQAAKALADCVIPNEYGIDAGGKTRIGGKICCALLGKLLADLANMREESLATAVCALCTFF